jgi:hypothetical protein
VVPPSAVPEIQRELETLPMNTNLTLLQLSSMTDPVSVSATILTILQVAASVVSFIRDLKDASQALKKLQAEIEDLQVVLSHVKELGGKVEISDEHTEKLVCSHVPLQECLAQLEKLKDKFGPIRGLDRTRRAVTWKFQQGEINQILASIERQKTLLMVGLQVETQSGRLYPESREPTTNCAQNSLPQHSISVPAESVQSLKTPRRHRLSQRWQHH